MLSITDMQSPSFVVLWKGDFRFVAPSFKATQLSTRCGLRLLSEGWKTNFTKWILHKKIWVIWTYCRWTFSVSVLGSFLGFQDLRQSHLGFLPLFGGFTTAFVHLLVQLDPETVQSWKSRGMHRDAPWCCGHLALMMGLLRQTIYTAALVFKKLRRKETMPADCCAFCMSSAHCNIGSPLASLSSVKHVSMIRQRTRTKIKRTSD